MREETRSRILEAREELRRLLKYIDRYFNNNFLSETGDGPEIARILERTIKELKDILAEK